MLRPETPGYAQPAFGQKIKSLRMQKGLTAKALAERISVSPSMITKIEKGAANPSMDILSRLVTELQVTMADVMDTPSLPNPRGHGRVSLVRPDERKLLHLPQRDITYQLLTPDAQGEAEFVWVELEPGEGDTQTFTHKLGEESLLVLEGVLDVTVGDQVYPVTRGDCLTFDATLPHMYRNAGAEKAVWVYVAVPPTI
jgi:transcriptional regulator with XRE-family HTH domain